MAEEKIDARKADAHWIQYSEDVPRIRIDGIELPSLSFSIAIPLFTAAALSDADA